jgi:hypothetical protein
MKTGPFWNAKRTKGSWEIPQDMPKPKEKRARLKGKVFGERRCRSSQRVNP